MAPLEPRTERGVMSYFWQIMTYCDYRCPYCVYGMAPFDGRKRGPDTTADAWLDAWKRMHEKYGSGRIVVTGGEPTSYPGFDELVVKMCGMHWMEMDTSLQLSQPRLEKILDQVTPDVLRFSTSYHPSMTAFEPFIQKVKAITGRGFSCLCRLVAHPTVVSKIGEIRAQFQENGETLFVNPFNGEYKGNVYPDSYTPQEKAAVEGGTFVPTEEKAEEFHNDIEYVNQTLEAQSPKGKLCRSGFRHSRVEENGDVYRCFSYAEMKWMPLGNMFKDVALWDAPKVCGSDYCSWEKRWLVDEAERFRNQDPVVSNQLSQGTR